MGLQGREKNCALKASVRRKEECLRCRVRFVPLTRRSLVQASNSRRARERIAFSFVRRTRASRLNFFWQFYKYYPPPLCSACPYTSGTTVFPRAEYTRYTDGGVFSAISENSSAAVTVRIWLGYTRYLYIYYIHI